MLATVHPRVSVGTSAPSVGPPPPPGADHCHCRCCDVGGCCHTGVGHCTSFLGGVEWDTHNVQKSEHGVGEWVDEWVGGRWAVTWVGS